MKIIKTLVTIVIATIVTTSLFAKDTKTQDDHFYDAYNKEMAKFNERKITTEQLKKVLPKDNAVFSNPDIEVVAAYDYKDFYYITGKKKSPRGNREVQISITPSGYLLLGKIVDPTGKPVAKPVKPHDMSQHKGEAMITVGEGPKNLYVFTDVDCPYCIKFESQFEQIAKKGYTIHVYAYPLERLHPHAKKKSLYLMSLAKADRTGALKMIQGQKNLNRLWDIDHSKLKQYEPQLKKSVELGNKIGVRGTPAIFDEYGKPFDRRKL